MDSAPDLCSWALGWRRFKIYANGYVGANQVRCGYIWEPKGEIRATCLLHQDGDIIAHGIHDDESCHCGFNAFHSYFDLQTYEGKRKLDKLTIKGSPTFEINGIIKGRGEKFAVHHEGFRCEYAQIVCLHDDFNYDGSHIDVFNRKSVVGNASLLYGVPVFRTHREADKYAKQYGDFIPLDLRPQEDIQEEADIPVPHAPISSLSTQRLQSGILGRRELEDWKKIFHQEMREYLKTGRKG